MFQAVLFVVFNLVSTFLFADLPSFQKTTIQEDQEFYNSLSINNALSYETFKKDINAEKVKEAEIAFTDEKMKQEYNDLLETFEILKSKMQIPQEVTIKFATEDAIKEFFGFNQQEKKYLPKAFYSAFDRTIFFNLDFFKQINSAKIHLLLHELGHCKQHMRLGLAEFAKMPSFQAEREVELAAIKAVKCPICLLAIYASYPENQDLVDQGYLSKKEVFDYFKKAEEKDLCCAHKKIFNEKNSTLRKIKYNLIRLILYFSPSEIIEGFDSIPSLKDRLSNIEYH